MFKLLNKNLFFPNGYNSNGKFGFDNDFFAGGDWISWLSSGKPRKKLS
jgi:hypothetical protein